LRAAGSRLRSIPRSAGYSKNASTGRRSSCSHTYGRTAAGGVDFMRAFVDEAYGVPREQVIGSSVKLRFNAGGDRVSLSKLSELNTFNDREAKPLSIGLHIGRRPLLAFGNSDGDLPMMRYARSGSGPRLALLLHHDDAEREAAYDREFRLSPLSEALDKAGDYGLTVVSMKRDWKVVF